MKFSGLFLLALAACAPAPERTIEPDDEYVLIEFAAKLEEEQEKFRQLEKK